MLRSHQDTEAAMDRRLVEQALAGLFPTRAERVTEITVGGIVIKTCQRVAVVDSLPARLVIGEEGEHGADPL